MSTRFRHGAVAAAIAALAGATAPAFASPLSGTTQHVLLISIDGMHALDFRNCVADKTCPNLAALGAHGVNFTRTSTSMPSDSFPGLMAIVSGGTPRTVGAYYDVAYDRVLAPPQNTTGNGVAGGKCFAGVPNGTTTEFEEGIDLDQTKLNGGGPYATMDGGILSIDPTRLPRDPANNCAPVYPWNFVRTNTIYGVIHAAKGYTAWSDKHPSYASVSGPGDTSAANVDDYYSPEINSAVIALPGVKTATGMACAPVADPTQLGSWTDSFKNIQCYDQLKANAIVNQIKGLWHDGSRSAPVPVVFGMNFQAVSVGQKLIEGGSEKGGYLDAAGTFSAPLASEIAFVDANIGRMVSALQQQGLSDSTTLIITAKHGQSPIDPDRFFPIPGHAGTNGTSPANLIANLLPASESPTGTGIGPTEDDVSLLWLKRGSDVSSAVQTLEANASSAGIGEIFYGAGLQTMFGKPGLPPNDPRVPDIIVVPHTGVIYTGSTAKQAEHGGFAHDDTNVMLLVSNPALKARSVNTAVETTQVAPSILKMLGYDPKALDAVKLEGTAPLPDLF